MKELIWFSIPGAITLFAFYIRDPSRFTNNTLLAVAVAPMLGFAIHQLYRTIFELLGGWESARRSVIPRIQKHLGIAEARRAFLVWETTFYSSGFPDSLREHNRGTWHFIMSLRSAALASVLSVAVLLWPPCTLSPVDGELLLLFMFLAGLFLWKAELTFRSLARQEEAAFAVHVKLFQDSLDRFAPDIGREKREVPSQPVAPPTTALAPPIESSPPPNT